MLHLFQLQLSRATPALLFLYMAAMAGVGLLGLTGCWQQSANKLILTAAIQVTNKHKTCKNTNTNKHKNTNSFLLLQYRLEYRLENKPVQQTNKHTKKQKRHKQTLNKQLTNYVWHRQCHQVYEKANTNKHTRPTDKRPSPALGSTSGSDSNGDLARSAFHGDGEDPRARISSHMAGLAPGAVQTPHFIRQSSWTNLM